MALLPGTRLGPYEILAVAGSGGMGDVYQARDTRLHRLVAIKVLPGALLQDPDRRQRLEREARTVSSLSHPHICTLYDIGHQDGVDYLVMEYLDGQTLAERLRKGPLPMDEVARLALEIAGALDAAHRRGIVHRDLKPGNVMLTSTGAKLLDFGLAKLLYELPAGDALTAAPTQSAESGEGKIVGTPAYMSPEQAVGKSVDARTDVFSFGLLLYEMVTGQRAFRGDSHAELLAAVLRDTPTSARELRPEAGGEFELILQRCLEKDPPRRYADGTVLLDALRASEAMTAKRSAGVGRTRRAVIAALLLVALVAVGFSALTWRRLARERWTRRIVLPEITRLSESDQVVAAYKRAQEIQPLLGGDPEFEKIWRDVSTLASVETDPTAAEIFYKPYREPAAAWERLGISPLKGVRVPLGQLRWRIVKEGFAPVELAFGAPISTSLKLVPAGEAPAGMVRIPGGLNQYLATRKVELPDYYWLDRYEVTNREFKEFVDRGGYRKREYWKHPFEKSGRVLDFDEAMALFRDTTGRPGPSTWELGDYPRGQADFPVGGVSWYEAVAYAEFSGKTLPTFHHWFHAAGADTRFSDILPLSNFGGEGPAPVGSHEGLSPWGNYDMAGNVREWVWNATADTRRYTLGGSWNDPTYLFTGPDALDPFDRSPTLGVRCAIYPTRPPDEVYEPIETIYRNYAKERPVEDPVFEVYRSLHNYDPGPLDARVEGFDSSSEYWREERVSFAAAYGGERIPATLFIPRNTTPPYQAILYFPPGGALSLNSIRDAGTRQFAYLVRSGRAVLYPSYKGTYERRLPPGTAGPNEERDLEVQWSKDVRRSLDYLQSRPDISRDRLAYYGLSMGASFGPVIGALDFRFRALVLVAGGLNPEPTPPEIDPFNFATHVRTPVLMINGDHDFIFPPHESQEPLFDLLRLPPDKKRHVVLEGGHVPRHFQEIARETLDWLDRYLGPVNTTGTR